MTTYDSGTTPPPPPPTPDMYAGLHPAEAPVETLPPPPLPEPLAPETKKPEAFAVRNRRALIAGAAGTAIVAGLVFLSALGGGNGTSSEDAIKAASKELVATPAPTDATPTTETALGSGEATASTLPSGDANFDITNILPGDKTYTVKRQNGLESDMQVMALRNPNGDPRRFAESFWDGFSGFLNSDGSPTSEAVVNFTDSPDVSDTMTSFWDTVVKPYYDQKTPGFHLAVIPNPNDPPVFVTDHHGTVTMESGSLLIIFSNDGTVNGIGKDGADNGTPAHGLPAYEVHDFSASTNATDPEVTDTPTKVTQYSFDYDLLVP